MQTNDNEDDQITPEAGEVNAIRPLPSSDYFSTRRSPLSRTPRLAGSTRSSRSVRGRQNSSNSGWSSPSRLTMQPRPESGLRHVSTTTIKFHPTLKDEEDQHHSSTAIASTPSSKQPSSGASKKAPKPKQFSRLRPSLDKPNPIFRSTPNLNNISRPPSKPHHSPLEIDLVSDIGDNKAIGGGYVGAIPASFATQMAHAVGDLRQQRQVRQEETEMFGRLMMTRMNSLEEGFREVIHEMRENLKVKSMPGSRGRSSERPVAVRREKRAQMNREKGMGRASGSSGSSDLLETERVEENNA